MSVKQQQRRAARPLTQRIGARRRPRAPRGPSSDRQESGWSDAAVLDQQQTLLLAVLHRARGEVVSYDELRDAGIEYPASVVAELELSEFPLERSFGGAPGRKLGVRLDQRAPTPVDGPEDSDEATLTREPRRVAGWRAGIGLTSVAATVARRASLAGASYAAWTASKARAVAQSPRLHGIASRARAVAQSPRLHGTRDRARAVAKSPSLRGNARWIAPAVLVLVAGIVVALIAAGTGRTGHVTTEYRGSAPPSRGSRPARAPAGSVAPTTHSPSAPQSAAPPAPQSQAPASTPTPPAPQSQVPPSSANPPTPVSVASAAELESRGHAQLAAGAAPSAIPTLRQALAATGKDLAACVEPVSEACLTYAYALYDLGSALRVAGEPAAAVPILEQRLRIANQRPTVQGELQRARQEAGKHPTTASTSP